MTALAFLVSAQVSNSAQIYDCQWCEQYVKADERKAYGCRKLDKNAIATMRQDAFNGEYTADHCPALDINTPWMGWIFKLEQAQRNGYQLGRYEDSTIIEVDSLIAIRGFIERAKALAKSEVK